MPRWCLVVLLCLTCLAAPAKPVPVDPGRRKSEQNVKEEVDAALQKQIDQAIEKARAWLADGCAGDEFRKRHAEYLKAQVKQYQNLTEQYRKQAADLKGKDAAKAAQLEHSAKSFELSAKNFEQQAQDLRKSADRKAGAAEPPLYEALRFSLGEEALIGLALVQAGASPYDPVVQRIWKDQYSQPIPTTQYVIYTLALQLMLVDAMMHAPCGEGWPERGPKDPKDKDKKKDAKAAKEVQGPPIRKDEVMAWLQKRVDALAGTPHGGCWGYFLPAAATTSKGYTVSGGPEIGSDALLKMVTVANGDYSNTQYAVLGLKAAALCGVTPKDSDLMWRQVVQQFLTGQEADGRGVTLILEAEAHKKGKEPGFLQKGWEEVETGGQSKKRKAKVRGWGYSRIPPAPPPAKPGVVQGVVAPRATMTAAGLTALLVGRSELKLTPKETEKVDEGVRDGLAWMQENWTQILARDGYMAYGLERVGVLGGLKSVGGHAWYAEGAQALVKSQQADGSWPGGHSLPVETSLCLLFLTRGTREAYARPSYEVGEVSEAPKPPPPPREEIGEIPPVPPSATVPPAPPVPPTPPAPPAPPKTP